LAERRCEAAPRSQERGSTFWQLAVVDG